MLRGLVIRQTFLLVDGAIIMFILVAAGYEALRRGGVVADTLDPGLDDKQSAVTEESSSLAKVDSRAAYKTIVSNQLFGPVGQAAPEESEKPEAPPPPPEVVETALRLKLCGTAATFPTDPLATAVILNQDKNTMGTYFIGQEVVDHVTIEEIHQRKVILFNHQANRREVLLSEEEKNAQTVVASAAAPSAAPGPEARPRPAPAQSPSRVTVKRAEVIQDLFVNYADIVQTIKPEMYRDENGKVAGITAENLETLPLAQKLGVKNGDIFQTVNNERIDSEQKVMELVQKYQNASTLRIGLLRNGRPMVITYQVE